jgi:hypothetical protein
LERLQLSRQVAVVNVDKMQVEVPLQELMPDIGKPGVADEVASLRQQITEQARAAKADREQAERLRKEHQRALTAVQTQQKQFDAWLAELGKLAIGGEVTFLRPPGHGTVIELNLSGGQVKVQTPRGPLELRLQDLFPEALGQAPPNRRPGRSKETPDDPQNRPMLRRRPESRPARTNREILLATPPGTQVYVVPFRKRATLLRIVAEKDLAILQSGAFEMQIPLADIEP